MTPTIAAQYRYRWLRMRTSPGSGGVIEYGAVISFVILALIHEASGQGGATLPALSDFTVARVVGDVGGFKGLAEAAVVCGFLYLGTSFGLLALHPLGRG